MEMLVVSPPRPNVGEPLSVAAGLIAQYLFDCWMYEDAVNLWIRPSKLDELRMLRRPSRVVDIERIAQH